ncbi:MAG: hypothetical protein EOO45_19195 [Flavobacterium sp.]|nr:MAG: hypothetical protein EOO45_19195 [Flavobacterium sp.]
MTKKLFLFLQLLLVINYSNAQTTETFETESNNSTTFTDNGLAFSITSQLGGPFDVQGLYPGTGWSGTANDHRYIDNDSYAAFNRPTQFTISSSGAAPFTLKSIWLFLSTDGLVLQPSGSVTITGRLGGVDKFTAIATSGFNNSMSVNNGFTFINMATFGGTDNSGISIDQYVITTSNNINYVCLDAMRWQQGASAISSTTKTNVTCYGGSNGTASVTAGGAVSYDWTPGNPSGDGTASVTGLTAGNWTCTVTFSGGSTSSAVITIGQPSAPVDATLSQTNILCYGASTGSASVTAFGGTGSYSYYWSNGATGPSITGLPAGIYSVVIFDGNNCTSFKNFNITQPSEFTATTSQNNVSCYGSNNGSATVSPSGGVGSYTYLWSNGATGSSATGLAPGNYSVTIRDANNCSLSKNFSITQPQALVASTYQENVLTYGGTTGAASVTPSGGAGGYSYLWSTGATGQSIAGVAAGNYSVTITDASNCSIIKNFAIMGPVLFVKQGANGSGSSWSDASGNLQAMINLATAGMQVWVAGGTYQPQANTSYSMKEGVKIYGGFPASGLPVMENRNYSIYATVLEGNNNRVINNDGNWLTNAAVLDGFTILGGTTGENGAGMKNSGSYPYIANCIFKSNNALNWGGGIFNNGAGSTMLVNCLFYNNLAGGGGASFDNLGTTTQYINCTVTKNHSGQSIFNRRRDR